MCKNFCGVWLMLSASGLGLVIGASTAQAATTWSDAEMFNNNAESDADSDYYVHCAHDAQGNWVCAWSAAVPAASNRDFDTLVSISNDDGATWSTPVELDPYAVNPPEVGDDFHPVVVTDRAGHWVAAWYTHDDHGGILGSDMDILVSQSSDNGATWTASTPLNTDAAVDSTGDPTPSIATDGNGLWVAVWSKRLTEDGDSDLFVAQSTDQGVTWSAPALLHNSMATDAGDDGSPSIAVDAAGHWLVAWSSDENLGGAIETDEDIFASASTNGFDWTAPAPVNSDAALPGQLDDRGVRVSTDGVGRWLAVWYHGVYEVDYDIKVAHSDDHGVSWSPVAYLNNNALTDFGKDLNPSPATDGAGNWIVVWESKQALIPQMLADDDILFATSTDNGETWSSVGVVNSYAALNFENADDRDPEVYYAADGRWRAIWGSKYMLGSIGADYDLLTATACFPRSAGDYDCDGDADGDDFAHFADCLTGPTDAGPPIVLPTLCQAAFDAVPEDGAIDLVDFAALQEVWAVP